MKTIKTIKTIFSIIANSMFLVVAFTAILGWNILGWASGAQGGLSGVEFDILWKSVIVITSINIIIFGTCGLIIKKNPINLWKISAKYLLSKFAENLIK